MAECREPVRSLAYGGLTACNFDPRQIRDHGDDQLVHTLAYIASLLGPKMHVLQSGVRLVQGSRVARGSRR
jgi:hypothetical protein